MISNPDSAKPDCVLWTGPVWAGNLAKVQWSHPTEIISLSCEGSDNCATIASNLPATGKLAALLKSKGRFQDGYNRIFLGSFSAGHGLSNILLSDPESADRITGFGAFDSYYTGPTPGLKKGYLAFANLAASGDGHLMWTSCSGIPDRKWLSCEDSIKPLLDAISPSDDTLPPDLAERLKPPEYFVSKYGFLHAFYGMTYKHAEHATVVAPAVFELWLSPLSHGEPPTSWLKKGAVAAGGIVAAIGAWKLGKRLRGAR